MWDLHFAGSEKVQRLAEAGKMNIYFSFRGRLVTQPALEAGNLSPVYTHFEAAPAFRK